jgi:hypothetical protein
VAAIEVASAEIVAAAVTLAGASAEISAASADIAAVSAEIAAAAAIIINITIHRDSMINFYRRFLPGDTPPAHRCTLR